VKDWVTLIYFKLKGISFKTDSDDFVDELTVDMINEGLRYVGVMMI